MDNAVVTLTPAEGVTGKADVTNVFTGDSLDTAAVDPADVTLTDETAVPSGYLTRIQQTARLMLPRIRQQAPMS